VTNSLEAVSVDFLRLQQSFDAIGQLQLAARAQWRVLQQIENLRGENVTADDGILRGASAGFGFSTSPETSNRRGLSGTGFPSSTPYAEIASPSMTWVATIDDWTFSKTSIICFRQGVSESITSSGRMTAKGSSPTRSAPSARRAQAHRFLLPDVGKPHHVRNLPAQRQQIVLPRFSSVHSSS